MFELVYYKCKNYSLLFADDLVMTLLFKKPSHFKNEIRSRMKKIRKKMRLLKQIRYESHPNVFFALITPTANLSYKWDFNLEMQNELFEMP